MSVIPGDSGILLGTLQIPLEESASASCWLEAEHGRPGDFVCASQQLGTQREPQAKGQHQDADRGSQAKGKEGGRGSRVHARACRLCGARTPSLPVAWSGGHLSDVRMGE